MLNFNLDEADRRSVRRSDLPARLAKDPKRKVKRTAIPGEVELAPAIDCTGSERSGLKTPLFGNDFHTLIRPPPVRVMTW